MYQQDAQHSGRSPHAGPRQATLLRRFDAAAPQNMPPDPLTPRADYQSSSVIGPNGTIYVANFPGMLFALRDSASAADQLDVAWRFHPPASSSLHATPALSGDGSTVYLGFASGGFGTNGPPPRATLYALKAPASGTDPQVVWAADLGAARVMASPTVGPDGTIYVANSAGLLFAVAANGSVKWTAQTGPTVKSAPALASDGTVYHATSDGKMYAVSSQGQMKWSFGDNSDTTETPSQCPGAGNPPLWIAHRYLHYSPAAGFPVTLTERFNLHVTEYWYDSAGTPHPPEDLGDFQPAIEVQPGPAGGFSKVIVQEEGVPVG